MSNKNQTVGQMTAQHAFKRKKRKKVIKAIIWLLIIAAAVFFVLTKFGVIGEKGEAVEQKLTTYTVGTRTITHVLTSSGTIEPKAQYTINPLVSGEILADYFEEGDTVIEDQLLYKVDSGNLDSSVTRAENSLKNANESLDDALENLEKLNVKSEITGMIEELHVEIGDDINAGTLIADVVDNETMRIDVPFMEVDCEGISVGDDAVVTFDTYEEIDGTVLKISPVSSVNALGVKVKNVTISVKNRGSITTSTRAYARIGEAYCTADGVFYNNDEGQIFAKVSGEVVEIFCSEGERVYEGDVVVRLESKTLDKQIEKLRDSVKEAEDSLSDTYDSFDNYNIQAPITGKVISKSYKTGDTISGGMNGSSSLAVIYDMSALKFTMSIDELDIDKLDKGQEVIVTCDSRTGQKYYGAISNISIQGTTSSGTTVYPVEVTIENVEDFSRRTVSDDGTINKVYKTGMTSTEKEYSLAFSKSTADGTVYIYGDSIEILFANDGNVYLGEELLNHYIANSYSRGSEFYYFADDMSLLTVEVQNDKKMLRPGMNIDAEIVVEKRENVVAVPLAAVGRGNVVKVIKAHAEDADNDSAKTTAKEDEKQSSGMPERPENGKMPENMPEFDKDSMPEGFGENFDPKNFNPENFAGERPSFDAEGKNNKQGAAGNMRSSYGTADIDTKYEEVKVTVGISDDDYVEITSGLNVGDVVVIETQNLTSGNQQMQMGMMGGGMMGGRPSGMGGGMMGGGMPSGGIMGGSRPSGMGPGMMGR